MENGQFLMKALVCSHKENVFIQSKKNICLLFRTWHDMDSKGVSAINCAYAGFEFDDRYSKPVLKCSDCPVIMLNTMPAVDMMIEHASCSPVCKFVARVKGPDYFKYAIEIRNIALKKAGKPALNVKATDVKTALRSWLEFLAFDLFSCLVLAVMIGPLTMLTSM